MWLFALLIALPLIEVGLFVTLGGWLGLGLTLAIVMGTALLGIVVIRAQGVQASHDLRRALEARQNPGGTLAGGVFKIAAGVLLILPGFFTDTLGLLLLIPPVRDLLIRLLVERMKLRVGMPSRGSEGARRGAEVIDGTWEELPPQDAPRPPSGWTRH